MFLSRKNWSDVVLLLLLLFCGGGLLLWSRPVAASITQTVGICTQVLLPSLYPFFVLSNLLVSTGVVHRLSPLFSPWTTRLFGLPGCCGAAVLLGMVGGYPVGAKVVTELYQKGCCDKKDALHTLRFCNNAGPAFLIGAVGAGLLKDAALGVLLYGLHLISALLLGLIFHDKSYIVKKNNFTDNTSGKRSLIPCFLTSVTTAFASFLNVCAFVFLFAVILCLIRQLPFIGRLNTLWQGLLFGFLELTAGAELLTQAALARKIRLAALSFVCGWGGCSVQLQTIQLLREAGLPCRSYLKSKLLHGGLSAMISILLC